MEKLEKYLQEINFAYIKTVSGLRGKKFNDLCNSNIDKIKKLESELDDKRYMEKSKAMLVIQNLKSEINSNYAVDNKGAFHRSSTEISTLSKDDRQYVKLKEIICNNESPSYASGCIPFYRDCIVFYDVNNEVKGVLQICFECERVKNSKNTSYLYKHGSYQKLKEVLNEFGHNIE